MSYLCLVCEGAASQSETSNSPGGRILKSDRFVGREAELSQLVAGLASARAGRGAIFLIVGERGLGKTTLATEFADRATAEGALVIWGRSFEELPPPPNRLWLRVLQQLPAPAAQPVDDLPPVLSIERLVGWLSAGANAEQNDIDLLDATLATLRAHSRTRPLVVILDDLHLADAASLRALQFISREVRESGLVIVGIYRDEEIKRRPLLAEAFGGIDQGAHHIAPQRLSRDEVAEFLRSRAGVEVDGDFLSEIHEQTGGSPFFLEKIAGVLLALGAKGAQSAGELSIPAGVREEVVGYRLRGLSEECRALLRVGAVIESELSIDLLVRVAAGLTHLPAAYTRLSERGVVSRAVDEALQTRLLSSAPGRADAYAFTYPLVRAALYDDVPLAERTEIHRRTAEALEELHEKELRSLLEIARHFSRGGQGGSVDKGIHYAVQAGANALSQFRYDMASACYESAAEALRAYGLTAGKTESQRQLCEVLIALGDARRRSRRGTAAKESCREAASIARELIDRGEVAVGAILLAHAALGYGAVRAWSTVGIIDDVLVELLSDALRVLNDGDNPWRARVLGRLAQESWYADFDSGSSRTALADTAVAMARRLGDPGLLADVLCNWHMAAWFPETLGERLAATLEVLSLARQSHDREREAFGHALRALDLLESGAMIDHAREVGLCADLAQELHDDVLAWEMDVLRATRATFEGRLDEAEHLAESVRDRGQQVQPIDAPMFFAVHHYALRRLQGRSEEIELLAKAFSDTHPTIPIWRVGVADTYAQSGKAADVRQAFEVFAAANFVEPPRDWMWLLANCLLSEVCAFLDDKPRAAILYERILPFARHNATSVPGTACIGAVAYQLGLLATTLERWADAARHFEDAIAMNLGMGGLPFAAHARMAYAESLRRYLEVVPESTFVVSASREKPEVSAPLGQRGALVRKATSLAYDAITTYEQLGMQWHAERAQGTRWQIESLAQQCEAKSSINRWSRDGHHWRITFQGQSAKVRDYAGIQYIIHLLRHPNTPIHVIDLEITADSTRSASSPKLTSQNRQFSGEDLAIRRVGKDPPLLDARARREYQVRLRDLDSDIAQAEADNDLGHVERYRKEREQLKTALSDALRSSGPVEDARKRVWRNIWRQSVPAIRNGFAGIGRSSLALHQDRNDMPIRAEDPDQMGTE